MSLDTKNFDPNTVGNPDNNIFGLPSTEDDSRLIIIPVPWEVTVSYNAGTARAPEHIMKASLQVDLYDADNTDAWKEGFYMLKPNQKILTKSDYLRKEAELYIDYISRGEDINKNKFMCKSLTEINDGGSYLNKWVYEQSKKYFEKNKLVAVLGGDHSTPLGLMRAVADQYPSYGVLQIDAHCDLRKAYEDFTYSHASIMYNALETIPQITKLVQVGVRDYGSDEVEYIKNANGRVATLFDQTIRERVYENGTWLSLVDEIVAQLPEHVYISFDIDGLKPYLCPHTGTPVMGGLEAEDVFYIIKQLRKAGKKIIGFDLNEVGISSNEWDENVGARVLYKLCGYLVGSNK